MLTGSDETRLSSVHAEHLALRLTRGGLLQIGSVLFFYVFSCPSTWASVSVNVVGMGGGVSFGFPRRVLARVPLK